MEVHGCVDLHPLLDEDQGCLLAVRGDPGPDHDRGGLLTLEVAQNIDAKGLFAGTKDPIILHVVYGLHSEKFFICPQDRQRCAILHNFKELATSVQMLGLFVFREDLPSAFCEESSLGPAGTPST